MRQGRYKRDRKSERESEIDNKTLRKEKLEKNGYRKLMGNLTMAVKAVAFLGSRWEFYYLFLQHKIKKKGFSDD